LKWYYEENSETWLAFIIRPHNSLSIC